MQTRSLWCFVFFLRVVNASNNTVFCSAINLYGYYPLYSTEACAAAASPVGTAVKHRCSGTSCDDSTFSSPCSDGLYTDKATCESGKCTISWTASCQENRVVKQTYFSVGVCTLSAYSSINGGTQSICESRGGNWYWPSSQEACRNAAAQHHYIYFSTCASCQNAYK